MCSFESLLLMVFFEGMLLKCDTYQLQGSMNMEAIQIIKKCGGALKDSFLDEG